MAKECTVIVYGDLGRSPRMQNHAVEILNSGYKVNLLGYLENPIRADLSNNSNLRVINLTSTLVNSLKKLPRSLYLLYAVLRIFFEALFLTYVLLFKLGRQDFFLIQNPPSIPVMAITYFVKLVKRSKFVIDFHNYGYTILGLSLRNQMIVKLAQKYERFFGQKADFVFCVSQAMQKDLALGWNIVGRHKGQNYPVVLYDKSNLDVFRPLTDREKHVFLKKMKLKWNPEDNYDSMFTEELLDEIKYKKDRPIFMVSSTSWTKDEDFGILLQALEAYDMLGNELSDRKRTARLFVAITGKGPEKEYYERIIKERQPNWNYVRVALLWLKPEDYPKLLACCDIGVCLHYSSSGLDLPMKVVDMFGAGIPVLAKRFNAIDELVQNQYNGLLFDQANDLFELMMILFKDFPNDYKMLQNLKENVLNFRKENFHDEWNKKARSLLIN